MLVGVGVNYWGSILGADDQFCLVTSYDTYPSWIYITCNITNTSIYSTDTLTTHSSEEPLITLHITVMPSPDDRGELMDGTRCKDRGPEIGAMAAWHFMSILVNKGTALFYAGYI